MNSKRQIIYFGLILIAFFVLFRKLNKENFSTGLYGMGYTQERGYYQCCVDKGNCEHPDCQMYLHYNQSQMEHVGVIYQKNDNKKIYNLFRRMNVDHRDYEFIVEKRNADGTASIYDTLENKRYMYDGDEFEYNGETFVASLQYSDSGHANIYHDSIYTYPDLINNVARQGLFYRYPYRFGGRHIRPGHHPVQVYDRSNYFYPQSVINGNMFYNGILKKKMVMMMIL